MPPLKIQPIDSESYGESLIRNEAATKPVMKSRFKRLFDLQFPNVLRISTTEKPTTGVSEVHGKDGEIFEPSSVCLAKMVQNFIEDSNEKQVAQKCGRNRCNCFNGNSNDSSDEEFDTAGFGDSIPTAWCGDFSDTIKGLIQCSSVDERNLLADTSKIIETNKNCKRKDDLIAVVTGGLLFLGYDASICKSRWEKSPSYPAGEYEYIDVIAEGGRVLIDIDFRSEFEIARPTGNYKTILQNLPYIFVGRSDRLQQLVSIVSEAAKQSLKKRGMHIPPWRKFEYMRAKWLSSHTRTTSPPNDILETVEEMENVANNNQCCVNCDCDQKLVSLPENVSVCDEKIPAMNLPWQPPAVKPKSCDRGGKAVVTGLASLFKERA
ncbi:Bifunctional DNA-directed RNA polymerase subunit beta-beta [Heracleum sosnowskyi]|uniref:Bifunctional DNA-directed RNA polymerase subunit beta-beta n=1 Tax=Heracleum sosnowskyi TaxID=360622 RepID=A0AAD8MX05_9APIA|nr:Bifunctional DNA-directed RNA polymerase subunit beta-beta [Heracleum sosnowskyi]